MTDPSAPNHCHVNRWPKVDIDFEMCIDNQCKERWFGLDQLERCSDLPSCISYSGSDHAVDLKDRLVVSADLWLRCQHLGMWFIRLACDVGTPEFQGCVNSMVV